MPKLSATQKFNRKKAEKIVKLEADFAGIKAGQMMFVATPQIVDKYIRKIPYGDYRTIHAMRNELARRHKCAASCPVSTSIFIRLSAEAAIEQIQASKPVNEVTPFWRLLSKNDKIAERLPIDPNWIETQRELEGIKNTP